MKTMILDSLTMNSSKSLTKEILAVILGSLYIALLAQIEIPLVPIPVTMHTFAVLSLALFQGANRSFFSNILYLAQATAGLPVFPHIVSDPLSMLDPSAGFLISFPIAAYVAGKIAEWKTAFSPVLIYALATCCGQLIIELIGVGWLSFELGLQTAFEIGLYPFIGFDCVKLMAVVASKATAMHVAQFISFYNK